MVGRFILNLRRHQTRAGVCLSSLFNMKNAENYVCLGVFAVKPIKGGTFIGKYAGELLKADEADQRAR